MPSRPFEDIWPLSPLQEGLLFHALYDPDEAADVYNVQLVLRLHGEVDRGDLRVAAEELVRRHPNLRAAFRQRRNGDFVQLVMRDALPGWREADLTAVPEADREDALRELLAKDQRERFDLSRAPAMRFTVVRMGDGDHRLV